MDKTEIIVAGILFFSLAITAFLLTLIEFVNMDKHPDKYKNPRYKKSLKGALKMAKKTKPVLKGSIAAKKASTKKTVTAKKAVAKKTVAAKKSVTKKTVTPKRAVGRSAKRK